MTSEELDATTRDIEQGEASVVQLLDLVEALRTAWAERDEARQAYVEAAQQRNDAESRHSFCDENKKDLRAHRDRLEAELADAKTTIEMLNRARNAQHEISSDVMKERDARPDAATVEKVVELLRGIEDGPMSNAAAKLLVEALRLLEGKP